MTGGSNEDLDGYVTEVDYPTRLIPQLTPGWIAAAAAWHGVANPDPQGAYRMLDLGCGTGIALAMSAACHPAAEFQGLDGMASHVAAGQAFARDVPNLALTHATFDQALPMARADCEIVTMHGVLTWAGAAARDSAMALAARRLAPGGLMVASYNAYPGAARLLPFQHLVRTFTADGKGPPGARYRAAFQRISALADAGFDAVSPRVVERLADLAREAPDDYFVHEYMHGGWEPLWAAEVKARFAAFGLQYIGQADFLRLRPAFSLTPRQRLVVDEADPAERDLLIDMALDTPFRIDLYARDPDIDEAGALRDAAWLGAEAEAGDRLDIDFPSRAGDFDIDTAHRVLEALEAGPRPVAELRREIRGDPERFAEVLDALLVGDRLMPLAQPLESLPPAARALNARLAELALTSDELPVAAVAGRAGPVAARPVEIAALALAPEDMLARATADPAFRARFLHPGVDLSSSAGRDRVVAGLARLKARFRRLACD